MLIDGEERWANFWQSLTKGGVEVKTPTTLADMICEQSLSVLVSKICFFWAIKLPYLCESWQIYYDWYMGIDIFCVTNLTQTVILFP